MSRPWDGLLLLDKPCGPTSHDIVDRVRRATGSRRVGHAGTLDPGASGLLPVVVGPWTRLIRFMPSSPKLYVGTLVLGATSDTDDLCGRVARPETPLPDPDAVLEAARAFLGRSLQAPPAVSARKVGGERMYRLARRGEPVAGAASPIEVWRFDLEPATGVGEYRFTAEVSGGTYVRALCRDLGVRLGCGGLLGELRRLRIGPMDVARALGAGPGRLDPDALREALVPPEAMPLGPPPLRLPDPADAARFGRGQTIRLPEPTAGAAEEQVRVLSPDGRLLGIAELRGGLLLPRVVPRRAEP